VILTGHHTVLRPAESSDFPEFYKWSYQMPPFHILANRKPLALYPEALEALVSPDRLLLAVSDRTFAPKGYASVYSADPIDQRANVDFFTTDECPALVRLEGCLLFLDFLFGWYPLRALYSRVPSNSDEERFLRRFGFREEGTLSEGLWNDEASFVDLAVITLTRDAWQSHRDSVIDSLAIAHRMDNPS